MTSFVPTLQKRETVLSLLPLTQGQRACVGFCGATEVHLKVFYQLYLFFEFYWHVRLRDASNNVDFFCLALILPFLNEFKLFNVFFGKYQTGPIIEEDSC
jgi:hypothetical protein